MSHTPESEEIDRFMVTIAAEEVSSGNGSARSHLGEIVPAHRRVYFYARPEEEGVRFSIEILEKSLEETGCAHLVDWRKNSDTRGLRYTTALIPVPDRLKDFTSEAARDEWAAWKAGLKDEQSVLACEALKSAGMEVPLSLSEAVKQANVSAEAVTAKNEKTLKKPEVEQKPKPEPRDFEKPEKDGDLRDRIRIRAERMNARRRTSAQSVIGRKDREER